MRQPRVLAIEPVDAPAAGPGEARVKPEGRGVCGSNLPIWEGRPWLRYPPDPGAPGQKGWGTVVDAVGRAARLKRLRAAIGEQARACGEACGEKAR